MTAPTPIRVFLLDDHEIVRRGLRTLLEAEDDIEVVGEAGRVAEAIPKILELRPDVAILDGRLPDGSGIEVCREVRAVDPSIKGLILTSYDDDDAMFTAILAGAAGYVLKQIDGTTLLTGIRAVVQGHSLIDPSVAVRVIDRMRNGQAAGPVELASLTPAGEEDPLADRGGADQPSDRRADVPRREDRQEPRHQRARQARGRAAHPGSRPGLEAPAPVTHPAGWGGGPTPCGPSAPG